LHKEALGLFRESRDIGGVAFTLGAMGSSRHNFYNDAFRRAGYEDAAREVQRLWLDGKREEATARVPDELAVKANLLGTEQMVRERAARLSMTSSEMPEAA
jgi:hypothetical protein